MAWDPSLEHEPKPEDYAEVMRWEETRLRARILQETHRQDLVNRQVLQYGPARAKLIGEPDRSVNFHKALCRQLSVLYMDRGTIQHPDGPLPELLGEDVPGADGESIRRPGFIENAGFWSIMGRVQLWTLGLNEMLIHPCVVDAETNPRVVYRVVEPSCVTAIAAYDDPTKPVGLRWLTKRTDPQTGKTGWCWDEWDIQDPSAPSYRIIAANKDGKDGDDVTDRFLDGTTRATVYDQWTRADGTPVIPWVIYHKHWPQGLWDPYDGKAAVEGTMMLSIDWAYWRHCFQEAAFPQRWSMGCSVKPDFVEQENGNTPATAHVVVDPTRIIEFTVHDNATNPQVSQFDPGADVKVLGEALAAREARLGQQMGVDASDLVRTSGDPRSGYALAISQEAKRQAQVTYKPQFERSDKELIALTAILLNRATGSAFPEADYSIRYADVTAPSALTTSSETDPTAPQPDPAPKDQPEPSPAQAAK